MPISLEEFDRLPKERPSKEQLFRERIESLIESKESFERYVTVSYSRKLDFPKSSYHFHRRVLDSIRKQQYGELLTNKHFLDLVYATLATWGLDRMDGKARLVDFNTFEESVRDHSTILQNLSKFKLRTISDPDKKLVKSELSIIYENLQVMETRAKLVGGSKALHHLLPDLVPPVDRKHTLVFFYNSRDYNEKKGKLKFLEIFDAFHNICRTLNLAERDLKREWDTSIPKLIDNAIIGYVSKMLTIKKRSK